MKLTEYFTVQEMTKTSQPYNNSLDSIKDERKKSDILKNLIKDGLCTLLCCLIVVFLCWFTLYINS